MRTIDVIQDQSNRNQSLRLLMLLIIAGTFPFYCFAIYFIGSAPADVYTGEGYESPQTAEQAPTFTPLGANLFPSPVATDGPAAAPNLYAAEPADSHTSSIRPADFYSRPNHRRADAGQPDADCDGSGIDADRARDIGDSGC